MRTDHLDDRRILLCRSRRSGDQIGQFSRGKLQLAAAAAAIDLRSERRCMGSSSFAAAGTAIAVGVSAILVFLVAWESPTPEQGCPSAALDSGDPYRVLGVSADADRPAIVKAYRKLAKCWHPDKHSGGDGATEAFSRISHAHDILTDPEKRDIFDRLGERGLERFRDGDPSVRKDWLPPDEANPEGAAACFTAAGAGFLA